MRCEECIPLIEEYFDGEVDERTNALIGAHMAACADCAAALDALSFEQEIYSRYDRELEVTPALWARVSAEIARESSSAERNGERRPFLTRVREGVAATLGSLALRPALASSLALVVIGVTAGSLWLSQRQQNQQPSRPDAGLVAKREVVGRADVTPPPDLPPPPPPAPTEGTQAGLSNEGGAGVELASLRTAAPRGERGAQAEAAPAEIDVAALLSEAQALAAGDGAALLDVVNHSPQSQEPIIAEGSRVASDAPAADARLLNPEQKEVARHVEQTQMLLRSIKNARAADDNTVNVAYEKQLSRQLLAENATLQLEAEVNGDKDTKQVLDQIQPFLLDIANMRDKPSREEVRSIKERVKKDEIIAALQVY